MYKNAAELPDIEPPQKYLEIAKFFIVLLQASFRVSMGRNSQIWKKARHLNHQRERNGRHVDKDIKKQISIPISEKTGPIFAQPVNW